MTDPFPIPSSYMRYFEDQNVEIEYLKVENILYREEANFLEGFYYDPDTKAFYESVGLYKESKVHKMTPKEFQHNHLQAQPFKQDVLPSKYFGEGLAPRSATEFALLTYKERTVLIVDKKSMQVKKDKTYPIPSKLHEGWGMTSDQT